MTRTRDIALVWIAATMPVSPSYSPSTRHASLGDEFYDRVRPAAFPHLTLRYRNRRWADRVGLGVLSDEEWVGYFGRFEPLPDSFPEPLSLRYHGHQFGVYNPDLGDGRGFLFAQLHDADGRLLDLGTKGSGRTPWARMGDGRLTLRGGVREVLATEMLEALGVYTSKSFSLIETGEELERNDEAPPIRGAVLVRLSHSHLRIGTFQRFLALDQPDNILRALDYTIRTYRPELWRDTPAERATAFLERLCRDVAEMGATWMTAGFVHGVLNTDNINVTGESFDYGPWRFVPVYDPNFTAAYFDHQQRYAFGRQPSVLLWNLTRLAECFLPFAPQDALEAILSGFGAAVQAAFRRHTLRRLGLQATDAEADERIVESFWTFLRESRAPFEQVFFDWYGGRLSSTRAARSPAAEHYRSPAFEAVRSALDEAEPCPAVRLDHPYFAGDTPCAMLIEEVDALLERIVHQDDWTPFDGKLRAIGTMAEAYGRDSSSS